MKLLPQHCGAMLLTMERARVGGWVLRIGWVGGWADGWVDRWARARARGFVESKTQ
jgi:hypothetical protein